jgi:predicted component of viral defense system (DUF524 family)
MLFNIVLEKVVTEANLDISGTNKSVQILAYADDIVIVRRYENAVTDAINRLAMEAQKMGPLIITKQNIWKVIN